jgi:photosystem II stability/assembly factor-like uncharacterized protein
MIRRSLLAASACVLALAAPARANGRYPAASQIAFDPGDPKHFVVSATFGLLESRDGGKTFAWMCEAGIGTSGQQDLMLAITASGATAIAMYNGIATTRDGCAFRSAPELAGKVMGDLALRKSAPHELVSFSVDLALDGGFDSQLVRSDDDGQTWAPLGSPLPADLYPLTVDVAPSKADRLFVSARTDKTKNFASVLLRSEGGAPFESITIPGTEQQRLAFIAAVHPLDPDRLYLRVLDPPATSILTSPDGGQTYTTLFTGTDQLLGFAVSPDGTQIAFGGPGDGLWVASADGSNLTRRSDLVPTCLAWSADGLYACADVKVSGFSVGRSTDAGATFAALLRFETLCGRTACGSASTATCSMEWDMVAPALASSCDAGTGSADASAPEPDASEAGPVAPRAPEPNASSGCACTGRPAVTQDRTLLLLWLFGLVISQRIRRS